MEALTTQITAQNTSRCKKCNKDVVKVRGGRRANRKRQVEYFYVDGKGRRWEGRVCPCRFSTREKKVREIKLKRESELGPKTPLFGAKLRRCPSCALPTVNYYKCPTCTPYRGASDMMDMYGVAI